MLYKNQYELPLFFISLVKRRWCRIKPNTVLIILGSHVLTRTDILASRLVSPADTNPAGIVGDRIGSLRGDAGKNYFDAKKEFSLTNQIKGYDCLDVIGQQVWISHFDLKLLKRLI